MLADEYILISFAHESPQGLMEQAVEVCLIQTTYYKLHQEPKQRQTLRVSCFVANEAQQP